MIVFFDSSALVKLFHFEDGTTTVKELAEHNIDSLWILELARLEFKSALYRHVRRGEISENQLKEAITGFDVQTSLFHVEPLTRCVLLEGEALMERYGINNGLRTLDALHLGAFSLLADRDSLFVAADDNLCNVAKIAGFNVMNPLWNGC